MVPNKQNRFRRQIPLVILLIVVVFSSGCISQTAQTQKVYHVGILSNSIDLDDVAEGFKAKMTEFGYTEGKNIIYDMQSSNNDEAKMQEIAKKFVDDKVDLILAYSTGNALGAKAATRGTDIPVVFAVSTIEGNDLIENVRQPGGNITGVRQPSVELAAKRLELLLEMAPQTKRVWLTYQSDFSPALTTLELLRPRASSLGVTLVEVPVTNVSGIQADLQARAESGDIGIDAILIIGEPLGNSPTGWAVINESAAKYKVPIMGQTPSQVYRGAVLTYLPDNYKIGQLTASMADKIFKGTPAGTIMVVTPKADLRINYKLAKELGLNVSEGMLNMADEIIR